jgi:hypothetical protein
MRRLEQLPIVLVLPDHKLLDHVEQPLSLLGLRRLGGELCGSGRGIIDQLSKQDGSCRDDRTPRPPLMDLLGFPDLAILLRNAGSVDRLEWKCDLDQLALDGAHVASLCISAVPYLSTSGHSS